MANLLDMMWECWWVMKLWGDWKVSELEILWVARREYLWEERWVSQLLAETWGLTKG